MENYLKAWTSTFAGGAQHSAFVDIAEVVAITYTRKDGDVYTQIHLKNGETLDLNISNPKPFVDELKCMMEEYHQETRVKNKQTNQEDKHEY